MNFPLLNFPVPDHFAEKALALGIIINLTAKKVIRLAPPINIDEATWHKGLDEVVQLIVSL